MLFKLQVGFTDTHFGMCVGLLLNKMYFLLRPQGHKRRRPSVIVIATYKIVHFPEHWDLTQPSVRCMLETQDVRGLALRVLVGDAFLVPLIIP